MATKALTEEKIRQLKPDKKRREIPDGKVRGLFYILQPSGAASWALRYRHNGVPRKLTLFGVDGLKDARQRAEELRGQIAKGIDLAGEKSAQRAPQPILPPESDSLAAVVDAFLKMHVAEKQNARSQKETESLLNRFVLPHWRTRKIGEITRKDARLLLDAVVASGAKTSANRVLSTLKVMFRFALDRYPIEFSPVADFAKPHKETARDRVLSDAELVATLARRRSDVVALFTDR
jgi:hypothetical protein